MKAAYFEVETHSRSQTSETLPLVGILYKKETDKRAAPTVNATTLSSASCGCDGCVNAMRIVKNQAEVTIWPFNQSVGKNSPHLW